MGFVRRRSKIFRFFASIGFIAVVLLAAPAQGAEIAGIDRVYLRDGPGSERSALGILDSGTHVEIVGAEGSWTKVKTQDGTVGFVYGRYVQAEPDTRSTDASTPAAAEASSAPEGGDSAAPTPLEDPTAQEIFTEIADLRSEIAALRQRVQEHSPESYAARRAGSVSAASPAPPPGAGALAFGTRSTRDQSAGVLVIALLSLLVGWVLGSAFTRRRSRSQRPRLRL